MIDKLRKLTIQEKFKVVDATKIYPDFHTSSFGNVPNFNIDEDWYSRVSEKLTECELDNILMS